MRLIMVNPLGLLGKLIIVMIYNQILEIEKLIVVYMCLLGEIERNYTWLNTKHFFLEKSAASDIFTRFRGPVSYTITIEIEYRLKIPSAGNNSQYFMSVLPSSAGFYFSKNRIESVFCNINLRIVKQCTQKQH